MLTNDLLLKAARGEATERITERFVLCVQWHPERMPKFHGDKVLKTFINKCIEYNNKDYIKKSL